MSKQLELLQEAHRRGILPPDKQPLYDEAVKRGLISGAAPEQKIEEHNPLTRFAAKAGDTAVGGLRFLATPGRMADRWVAEQAGKMGLPYPGVDIDEKGVRVSDVTKGPPKDFGYRNVPLSAPQGGVEQAADIGGTIAGYLVPGSAVGKGAKVATGVAKSIPGAGRVAKGTGDLLRRVTPSGGSVAARGARYTGRLAATAPEAAAHAVVLGAGTADGDDKLAAGVDMAQDPLTYLAIPAMSALYRGGVLAKTGGARATPKAIDARVTQSLGPQAAAGTRPQTVESRVLEAIPVPEGISEKDIVAVQRMTHRTLSDGGVPDDVITDAVSRYNSLANGGQGPRPSFRLFLGRALEAYPKALENLDNALYEIGQNAPEVADNLAKMRGSQAQRLKSGLDETLGKGERYDREQKLTGKMEDIGEAAYEPILAAGPVDDQAAAELRVLLNDAEFQAQIPAGYRTKLSMGGLDDATTYVPSKGLVKGKPAQRRPIQLNQRIQENPLEVAHKLYSSLGKRIRDGKDTDGKLAELRDAVRDPLFRAGGPDYQKANADYRTVAQARGKLGYADRLFTEANETHKVRALMDEYRNAPKEQRASMELSIKEKAQDELRRALTTQDFTNLGRLRREGVLDAIENILDVKKSTKGSDTVRQIRDALDEQAAIKAIDPTSKADQASRLEAGRRAYAGKTGALEYTGKLSLMDLGQDAVFSLATSALTGGTTVVPIRAGIRGAQRAASYFATPSKAARRTFARVMLEGEGAGSLPRKPAKAKRKPNPRQVRVNGKFGPNYEIMGNEADLPPSQSMQPHQEALDEVANGVMGRLLTGADRPAPRRALVNERALPSPDDFADSPAPRNPDNLPGRPTVSPAVLPEWMTQTDADQPMTAAEGYAAKVRRENREAQERLDRKAFEKEAARGDKRANMRAAEDAERQRREAQKLAARTASEDLKIQREKEAARRAEDRARRAAEPLPPYEPPPAKEYTGPRPFSKFGAMRDRQMAPGGDPKVLEGPIKFIIGQEEPAAVQASLNRIGRQDQAGGAIFEPYQMDMVNRITDLAKALRGQRGASQEAMQAVRGLNKANRDWLMEAIRSPGATDLTELLDRAARMGPGTLENTYKALGPPAAIVGGVGVAGLAAKGAYDASDKRTPEQREADRRRWVEEAAGKPEDALQMPDDVEVRQMQKALNRLGIRDRNGRPLVVDGDMGPKFRDAIIDFQQRNGLIQNFTAPGGLTNATIEELRNYYE